MIGACQDRDKFRGALRNAEKSGNQKRIDEAANKYNEAVKLVTLTRLHIKDTKTKISRYGKKLFNIRNNVDTGVRQYSMNDEERAEKILSLKSNLNKLIEERDERKKAGNSYDHIAKTINSMKINIKQHEKKLKNKSILNRNAKAIKATPTNIIQEIILNILTSQQMTTTQILEQWERRLSFDQYKIRDVENELDVMVGDKILCERETFGVRRYMKYSTFLRMKR